MTTTEALSKADGFAGLSLDKPKTGWIAADGRVHQITVPGWSLVMNVDYWMRHALITYQQALGKSAPSSQGLRNQLLQRIFALQDWDGEARTVPEYPAPLHARAQALKRCYSYVGVSTYVRSLRELETGVRSGRPSWMLIDEPGHTSMYFSPSLRPLASMQAIRVPTLIATPHMLQIRAADLVPSTYCFMGEDFDEL